MNVIANILALILSIISQIFSVVFIGSMLISGIVNGIVVRLIGGDIVEGAKAGAAYYVISALLLGTITGFLGISNALILTAINYLALAWLTSYLSGMDLPRSIVAAITAIQLNSLVFSLIRL